MRTIGRLLLFLAAATAVFAQTDRGTITGQVTDTSGAIIPNVPMELKSVETGVTYPGVSSATGNYTFSQLPIGTYDLTATAPGFKKFVRTNLPVQASQVLGIDVPLEVGAASESVTINAEVSLLKSESSDISTNVETKTLVDLGLLQIGAGASNLGVRNPVAAIQLSPATLQDSGKSIVRVNGAPQNTQAIRVEGQDAVTNVTGTRDQAQVQPSVDALQEITVQNSNFSAEYGKAGGGLFNYTVKSGTNQFHGVAYEYMANEFFNASQPYTGITPKLRQSDFGFNIGGPVWIPKIYNGKNRTFFFFNYEKYYTRSTTTTFQTVPTDAYRNGDFSAAMGATLKGTGGVTKDSQGQLAVGGMIYDPNSTAIGKDGLPYRTPYPGNKIPQQFWDSSALKILSIIPQANVPGGGLINNFTANVSSGRDTVLPGVKIDHSFSEKAKLSVYWGRTHTYTSGLNAGFPLLIDPAKPTDVSGITERVNFDYTLSPTTLLHLGAGYLSNNRSVTALVTNVDVAAVTGIKGAPRGPNQGGEFPIFGNFLGANSTGGMVAMNSASPQTSIQEKPTFNASITKVSGNHTFKFGGELMTEGFIQQNFQSTDGQFAFAADQTGNPWFANAGITLSGGATGFPFASFLIGRPSQVTIAALSETRGGRKYVAAFAQDTWKVNRKLTLDYGVRWDYFTYPKEEYGRTPDFSASVPNAVAGGHLGGTIFEGSGPGRCNCSFAHNYPLAFGPRVGVAYQVAPKTVIRAGIGISYSLPDGGIQPAAGATQTLSAPGVGNPAMILSQGFPVTPTWPVFSASLFPNPSTFSGTPPFIDSNYGRPARQIQWSFGVQREIVSGLLVEVAYVGNRGNWWQTSSLTELNGLQPSVLKSQYGLDVANPADVAILSAPIGSAAAKQFQNKLPFPGFPASFTVAQSLRPFPQFGSITGPAPLGKTWFDSMQMKVTKRFSHGLQANYAFTWSKELQLGTESETGGGYINDVFNRDTNKQLAGFDRPLVSVISLTYSTPKLQIQKYARAALSDWTVGTVLQYASGFLIPVPATATSSLSSALGGRGTYAVRVPGQPLYLQDLNCHCFDPANTQVLNPAAWTDPAPGTFSPGAAYYNDYRYARHPKESMSFGRVFRIREKMTLQIRAEFQNPFNRTQVPDPISGGPTTANQPADTPSTTNYTTAISTQTLANGLKVYSSGFGVMTTRPGTPIAGSRSGTMTARFTF